MSFTLEERGDEGPLVDTRPAPPRRSAVKPARRVAPKLPSTPAERAVLLRAHREVALRMIANDLRRLAQDLDLLEDADDVPARLATLVGAVMEAVGQPAPPLAPAPIVEAVCATFRVSHDEIVSRRRGQHVALARQVAIYLIREITDYSFPRIGEYFGRDHSTAIHSYTRISRRVAAETPFRTLMKKLKDTLAARSAAGQADDAPCPVLGAPMATANCLTMELCR
jgi:hypothetical protein